MTATRKLKRRYARRLPKAFARLDMICARVSKASRQSLQQLAERREISISEYLARLVNDHLTAALQQGLLT
jgi:RNA-binding protein YlmH